MIEGRRCGLWAGRCECRGQHLVGVVEIYASGRLPREQRAADCLLSAPSYPAYLIRSAVSLCENTCSPTKIPQAFPVSRMRPGEVSRPSNNPRNFIRQVFFTSAYDGGIIRLDWCALRSSHSPTISDSETLRTQLDSRALTFV